jgi:hypothetical protein
MLTLYVLAPILLFVILAGWWGWLCVRDGRQNARDYAHAAETARKYSPG